MIDETTELAKERTNLASERTRLANERTFLSWVRTGIACTGSGFAIIRLSIFSQPHKQLIAQIIGIILILLGTAMFLLSPFDYINSYKKLSLKAPFFGSFFSIFLISAILAGISILVLLLCLNLI